MGRGRPPTISSEILDFQKSIVLHLYSTSLNTGGRMAADGLCWHTSRESHPSEDLSELSPLLEAVAGQEYHYQIADEGRAG